MNIKTAFAAAALTALIIGAAASPAAAQSSASATGSGSITVIRPITLAKKTDLRFGTVVRPTSGTGGVAVDAKDQRSVSGGVVGLASGEAPSAAQFMVDGEGGQSVSIDIPATFTMANGKDTLTVTTTNDLQGKSAAQSLSNSLGSAGALAFKVGGAVPVSSTAATGVYTGSFVVSAVYN